MGPDLAERVGLAMARRQALEQQRAAVKIVLAKYSTAPSIAGWARDVLRSDEIRRYRLLYRIADRGVSC